MEYTGCPQPAETALQGRHQLFPIRAESGSGRDHATVQSGCDPSTSGRSSERRCLLPQVAGLGPAQLPKRGCPRADPPVGSPAHRPEPYGQYQCARSGDPTQARPADTFDPAHQFGHGHGPTHDHDDGTHRAHSSNGPSTRSGDHSNQRPSQHGTQHTPYARADRGQASGSAPNHCPAATAASGGQRSGRPAIATGPRCTGRQTHRPTGGDSPSGSHTHGGGETCDHPSPHESGSQNRGGHPRS